MILFESLILGFYFYIANQIIFLVRFGQFNSIIMLLDIFLYVAGVINCLLLLKSLKNKKKKQQKTLLLAFILAQPLAILGAIMGGLINGVFIVLGAVLPTAIIVITTNHYLKTKTQSEIA